MRCFLPHLAHAKAKASAATKLAKAKLTKKTKSAKKGKVTVAWEKVDGADGYEVKVGKGAAQLAKTVKAKKVKVKR